MRGGRLICAVLGLGALTLAGCHRQGVASPRACDPAQGDGAGVEAARVTLPAIDTRVFDDKPALSVIEREGDPRPALAVAVAVSEGPVAAVALEALVEARLAAAGFAASVDGAADRGGYRVRLLLEGPGAAARAVGAVREALLTPVGAGDAAGLKLAGARVMALRARPLDDAALVPVVACTGEAKLMGRDPLPDPKAPAFGQSLERWRAEHGAGTVALALVGPATMADEAAHALEEQRSWPEVSARDEDWPDEAQPAAYVEPGRRKGSAKLTVAMRVPQRGAAFSFAERATDARAPLLSRLAALPQPFAVRQVSSTVKRGGACIAVEAETNNITAPSLEEAAAVAAQVIRQEIQVELSAARDEHLVAARSIKALGDPREAAAAAAFWSLSRPGPERPPTSAIALGVSSAQTGQADPAEVSAATRQRLMRALAQASSNWAQPLLDGKSQVEAGQGEVWLLLASPCPITEAEGDAGTTALAALAAARVGDGQGGVSVEPWVGPDGAGVLAHASPLAKGETLGELASRVADAAARSLLAEPPSNSGVIAARASLLARLDASGQRSREGLSSLLWPGQPTRLSPWGLFDPVARGSSESVKLRWASLSSGPMRAAVLAGSKAQADASLRAVDRWMVRVGKPRACPAPPSAVPSRAGSHTLTVPPGTAPRAFVAVPLSASGAGEALAAATVAMLSGEGGLLARALSSFSTHADAYLLGQGQSAALIIELRGTEAELEPSAAQVKALLSRLAQGAASEQDAARATAEIAASELAARLDPRRRAIDLWRGRAEHRQPPTLPQLRAYHAAELRDEQVIVALAKAPSFIDLPR